MTTLLGDTVTVDFTTHDPTTGAAMSAGVLPTGVLVRNGVDSAEVVTVTLKAVGIYRAAVTVPAGWAAGDEVQIRIAATVNAIAGNAAVWGDTLDTVRSGEVATTIGVAGAGLTALGDARLANLDALVSAIPGAVWDELIAAHLNPGSTGEALNNIAGADPWATVLPGAYVAGSAGNIIGNFMTALPPAVAGLVIGVLNNVVCGKVCAPSRVSGSIVDIVMERYTTKQITGMVVDEAGYPYDLTDCNVEWRAGTYLTKSSATLPATITILAPATAGVFQFTITADESKTLPYGARSAGVEHECKVRNTITGEVHLVFSGRFRIDDTLIESM